MTPDPSDAVIVADEDESCLYGCGDPATCDYAHAGCGHCKRIRAGRTYVVDPELNVAVPDDEC